MDSPGEAEFKAGLGIGNDGETAADPAPLPGESPAETFNLHRVSLIFINFH